MTVAELDVIMRRHIETGDFVAAAEIAVQIDKVRGEPPENDHCPEPIPCWGVDA